MTNRKEVLSKRRNLTKNEISDLSYSIHRKLLESNILKEVNSVFTYLNYNNEVETLSLILQLLDSGICVSIPWTSINEKKIIPVSVDKKILKENLVTGPYGILQPADKILKNKPSALENIDICICPGSLFDRNGGRVGYGGGYYDRFLCKKELLGVIKIGLCFGFQLFDNIDQKKHDIKMNYIFTEEDVVKVG